ncbi:MAG TPA: hypothetical protein VMH79_01930 [Thermoanaerobaculia bacterium]|nr:hypothetical protein [Thermoanaerobaculia bacterium]
MRRFAAVVLAGLFALALGAQEKPAPEKKAAWPLSLADGLPKELPGYQAAPTDPLPDTDENEMGVFTQVARFFQRIENATTTRQFQLVVQDYGKDKNLEAALRQAMAEAATHPGVETRDVVIAGLKAFAVTDRSSGQPTTLITVLVLPSRLVLAQGGNVDRDAAIKLLSHVDFSRVAAAK